MIKNISTILFLILLVPVFVKADVPPPKGYTRVSLNLVIETKQDLSDYRFFVYFPGDLNEIAVKSPGKVSLPPFGGGARYILGTIYAVPKKSIESTSQNADREQLQNLYESIADEKIEGAIKLGEHTFADTVLTKNKRKVITPTYLIERKDRTLVMSVKKMMKKVEFEEDEPTESHPNKLIGGIFLSIFFLFGGAFLFRKKIKL